jgi:hypothetical protein
MKRATWLAQSLGVFLANGILAFAIVTQPVAANGRKSSSGSRSAQHPNDMEIRITLFCPSDTVVKINHATMLASGTKREFRSRVEDSNHHKYLVEVSRRATSANADGADGGSAWAPQEKELPLTAGQTLELFYKKDGLHELVFPTSVVPDHYPAAAQAVNAPSATSASKDSGPECVGSPQYTASCKPFKNLHSIKTATPLATSSPAEKDSVERLRTGTLPTLTEFSPNELAAEVEYDANGNLSSFAFCKYANGTTPPKTMTITDKNSWPKAFAPSDAKLAIVVRAYLKCGEKYECEYTPTTSESTAVRSPSSNGASPENGGSPFKLAFDGSWQNRVASMETSQLNRNVLNALTTLTPQINKLNPVMKIEIFGYMQYSSTILKDIRLLDNRIAVTVCETPPPESAPSPP